MGVLVAARLSYQFCIIVLVVRGWVSQSPPGSRSIAAAAGLLVLLVHPSLVIIDKLFIVRLNVSHCLLDSCVPSKSTHLV